MNTTAYLGPVTVQFQAGGPGLNLDIYKAFGYKKGKPADMNPEDVYVVADEGVPVTATFIGTADTVEVNEDLFTGIPTGPVELEDGVNEIAVSAGGLEYYLAVYVVRNVGATHAKSGGIVWDEDEEIYYFDDQGLVESFFSLFSSGVYEDDGITVSAPGEVPWTPSECGSGCCGGGCQNELPFTPGTETPLPLVSDISNYDTTTPATPVWPAVAPEAPPATDNGGCCGGGCSSTPDIAPAPEPSYSPPPAPSYDPAPSYSPPPPPPSYDSGSSGSSYDSGSSYSSSSSYDSGSSSSSYDSGSSSSGGCDSGGGW